MTKKQPREHVSTKLSLAPLPVDDAFAALLKTPPPPRAAEIAKPVRKRKRSRKAR